ncbi:MAG: hypothetical protein AAF541_18820 [Pseudomonadota bacterium]
MADIHIEEFYADAAKMLVSLYGIFPRPVTLFVEDICGPDEPDEYGVHSHRHQACFATMLFLANEGFIQFGQTIRSEAVDQASLTGKCFSSLMTPLAIELVSPVDKSLPPSVLTERSTVAFQLTEAIKLNNTERTSTIMLHLICEMTRSR